MSRKKRQTSIANSIDIAGIKAQYDACCKDLMSHRSILARLLCATVEELKGFSPEEVEKYIETPRVGECAADATTTDKIFGLNVEDNVINEGKRFYDILFDAIIPTTGKGIIVDVEIQKDYTPGYPIVVRGIYYASRLISSQYNKTFSHSDFNKLKKVYSIWICVDADKYHSNTIEEYFLSKRFLVKNKYSDLNEEKPYDLFNVIIVNVNENDKGEGYTGVIKMLATLLSSIITPTDKKSILNKEYGITITEEIDEEVEHMCNLSSIVEERGIERGEKRGIVKEKRATVKSLNGRLPIEEIAEVTRLTVEEVKKILSE